jgi:predicted TPR repeat methyltransferase
MTRRNLTSGNFVADKRADYAVMLADAGDPIAAADLMGQALELVPEWPAGWSRLGEFEEKAGNSRAAIVAWQRTLDLEPGDIFGAGLKLALHGAGVTPALPPSAYVEGLFDDYASRFDTALVDKLGYAVPSKLHDLIIHNTNPGRRFDCVVDFGCGTGLFGAEIRHRAVRLEGYDLSENMLAEARAKGLYDYLARANLSLAPDQSGLFSPGQATRADLVSAADVMIYLGDLDAAACNAESLLMPDGLFAFSVEKLDADHGFLLRNSLRYAHSETHVRSVLARYDLTVIAVEETGIRKDAGDWITGLLFLAGKR